MIRLLDILFSLFGLLLAFPFLLILFITGLFDTGSPIFTQERVGRNKKPFTLVKFRTMTVDTASVASHLASTASITPFGPRPGLFNQTDLIKAREAKNVFNVRPGITGLAQVNEIDMSTPELLAKTDREMIDTLTLNNYFKYIIMTISGSGSGDRVK